jgi:hypothetical protein
MRRSLVVAMALVAGCASGGGKKTDTDLGGGSQRVTTQVQGNQGIGSKVLGGWSEQEAYTKVVDAPLEKIWPLLPQMFADMQIPVTSLVSDAHVIGNEGFKVRRELAGAPMQRLLDCGGPTGESNAETYLITMTLLTQLKALNGAQTAVSTFIQATAKSMNFDNSPVQCTSSGGLEDRIIKGITNRLKLNP